MFVIRMLRLDSLVRSRWMLSCRREVFDDIFQYGLLKITQYANLKS